jgi:S-adenosylmethionine:tRNA ribosyltransferase-isomerase
MVLDCSSGRREHHGVADLPGLLEPGSLLVFNDSRVRKARLPGRAVSTGAEREFLLLEKLDAPGAAPGGGGLLWRVMVRRARRPGSRYVFAGGVEAEIAGEDGEFRVLRFDRPIDDEWLDRYGHIPLPPYIRRGDGSLDAERYQTVYAAKTGSAAAPTAGLHFSPELLRSLGEAGIESAFVTLHVGLGTFLPVRVENIEDHRMHRETYVIGEDAASRIERAKAEGRKIVAVGTTSVRTLESAWLPAASPGPAAPEGPPIGGGAAPGKAPALRRGEGSTGIFIYPGYRFKVVDQLFTNFHTPGSSLLMLVSAFAGTKAGAAAGQKTGRELILESYAEAIQAGYRFFSYGDAMLIR